VFFQRILRSHGLGVLAVLILTGAVYAQTLSFGFVWDDETIVFGRIDYQSPARWLEAVRQPLDFSPNYFRPLALSSLLVQLWVWKANPAPYHAANVLIHLVNTALVCALGLRLLRRRWQGLLAGALYGVHPALVESVAFVSSRYDLLATLFLLLALWLEGRLQGAARVAGVATAFLLALLCKEMALTLPLVMLLWQLAVGYPTDAKTPSSKVSPASQGEPPALGSPHAVGGTPRSGGRFSRAYVQDLLRRERALYTGLAVALGVYFALRYAALGYLFTAPPENLQIDAGTLLQHLLLVGRTLATLVGLAVFPFFSITPAHHSELPIPLGDGWAWAQLAIALAVVAGVGWSVRRQPRVGWLLAAGLVALLPVLNLRPLEFAFGVFTAERFLTFPLALILLGLTTGLFLWASSEARRVHAAQGATAGVYAALLLTTVYTLPNWRDAESFWKWFTVAAPRSPIGYNNLSDLYNKQGRHTEALEYAEKAIQVAPRSGMGYVNKGVALLRLGDPDAAIALFRQATEIEPHNIVGWNNLAVMLSERGEFDESERIIRERVLGRTPKFYGHQALGLLYARKGRLDLAEVEFRAAYALIPNPADTAAEQGLRELQQASKWIAAAHHWMNQRDLATAEAHLQAAAQRDPDRVAYGVALARLRILQNRPAEAKQALIDLRERGYRDGTLDALLAEAEQMLAKRPK
jgi:tetratricopeptide (TPR) repeat protein